jgi:hypothetical protein
VGVPLRQSPGSGVRLGSSLLGEYRDGLPCSRLPCVQAVDDEDYAPTGPIDLIEQRLDVPQASSRESVNVGDIQRLRRLPAKLID